VDVYVSRIASLLEIKFYYNGRDFDCKCEMDKYRPLDKTKYLMESELDANNNVINAYFPSKD
jgi:hypothetical protein